LRRSASNGRVDSAGDAACGCADEGAFAGSGGSANYGIDCAAGVLQLFHVNACVDGECSTIRGYDLCEFDVDLSVLSKIEILCGNDVCDLADQSAADGDCFDAVNADCLRHRDFELIADFAGAGIEIGG
jgi:hypothetical protein